jgi:hypothetical protein
MMPKIPVDECPAGPEMDAAVAEALGFKTKGFEYADGSKIFLCLVGKTASGNVAWRSIPAYSTDIAAAWVLAEKERMRIGWTEAWDVPYAACRELICEYADKHPLAICRAFLKANGVEHVEVPE